MSHYEASLEVDLTRLREKIREMADRNEHSLRDGLAALIRHDRQLAYSVILRDTFIDALDREIDRLCLEFIIRHQPCGSAFAVRRGGHQGESRSRKSGRLRAQYREAGAQAEQAPKASGP
jgi:hypothetical protein